MELDELKKSWNALNEQLQKEPIADEQQITELIAGYKANTQKSGTPCSHTTLLYRNRNDMSGYPSSYMAATTHLRFQRTTARKDCSLFRIHCHQHSRRHVVGLENIPLEQEYTY